MNPGNYTGSDPTSIGSFTLKFKTRDVIFGKLAGKLSNPSDPNTIRSFERTITGGTGKFGKVYWGVVDTVSVDRVKDLELVTVRQTTDSL